MTKPKVSLSLQDIEHFFFKTQTGRAIFVIVGAVLLGTAITIGALAGGSEGAAVAVLGLVLAVLILFVVGLVIYCIVEWVRYG